MKRLINIGLIALLALFFMASCKKEKVKPAPAKEAGITSSQMANIQNPYDKVGIIHNEFLNYFLGHVDSTTKINQKVLLAAIQGFYKAKGMDYGDQEQRAYSSVFNQLSKFKGLSPSSVKEYICSSFPKYCYSKINPSLPAFSSGGTTTERALGFIKGVKEKEGNVMNDSKINSGVKSIILSSYAIARYSMAYWHNASTNYLATFGVGTTATTTNNGTTYVPDLYPPPPPGPWNPGPITKFMTAAPLAFAIVTNGGGTSGGGYDPNDPQQWIPSVAIISTLVASNNTPFPMVDWTQF